MELCVLVGGEVYDIRLNAVWVLMVCKNITYPYIASYVSYVTACRAKIDKVGMYIKFHHSCQVCCMITNDVFKSLNEFLLLLNLTSNIL